MAKAKVLADRISISSEVLTDETIERVSILAPSILKLIDEKDETVLYEVAAGEYNSFTMYGSVFNGGKSLGTISDDIMELDDEAREKKVKTILAAVLTKINAIEAQVEEYLETAEDLADDVEFIG